MGKYWVFGVFCLAACWCRGQVQEIPLDGEWSFCRDDSAELQAGAVAFDDGAWQRVTVPHDWAISGPFNPDGDGNTGKLPWRGVGWYRKTVIVNKTDYPSAAVYLDFDGVMASPQVYVNGHLAGGWDYGYMGFRVDATPFFNLAGKNVVAVRADTRDHHSRWYPGAGIYRSARVVICPAVHVAHWSTFVTTPEVSAKKAVVRVDTAVTNRLEKAVPVKISLSVWRKGQNRPEAVHDFPSVPVAAGGVLQVSQTFTMKAPKLWDIESPNLYHATVSASVEGFGTDVSVTTFGIRSVAFPPDDGFHLNGRRVQLNGVDLHADMGPLGMAFDRSVMRRQLSIMKDMGVNALRTSHNAPDPKVLELCDEMGILVWNECFDKWDGTAGRRHDQNLEAYVSRNLRQFALRDRNHPSVIIWSISNEIPPADPKKPDDPGMTRERCSAFRDAIRAYDTTRPVGNGNCFQAAIGAGVFEDLDLTGWNYHEQYVPMKKKYPGKPVVYSESASALSSYGYYSQPPSSGKTAFAVADREVDSYDHNAAPWSDIPDWEFARMEKHAYCCGEFVWTGIDYLGEPTPYIGSLVKGVPNPELARSSYFGIVDLMGIPKDRFYLYRSHWNKKDETVHILPHWNWKGREGTKVPVYVYTSGDSAELFLNGKSLGRRAKGESAQAVNLAVGCSARASSAEVYPGKNNYVSAAVDGDDDTRWCAADGSVGVWWQVDLGRPADFGAIRVITERSADGYAYRVDLSDDGLAWRTFAEKPMGDANDCFVKPARARFCRVTFTALKPGTWASIREFVVADCADRSRLDPYYAVCDRYRLRWFDVPYEPGELKAVAYRDGRKIGTQVMRTAGKPVAVRLTPDPYNGKPAIGDVQFFQVDVVDVNGTRDPLATNRVSFRLMGSGVLAAVGNGNPRGYDAFTKTDSHPLYFGKAVVAVRRTGPGVITLTAEAEGLGASTLQWLDR
ncbi:MAG: DUF4982 domain-containing protein [Kiritimatiellae bacterium]|nr:DUF4982 domain-containing protein [Kiritimatiellia bacterium]